MFPIGTIEFLEQVLKVPFDGLFGEVERYGNFLVAEILRQQPEDFTLENGGAKLDHGSGGEVLLRAA